MLLHLGRRINDHQWGPNRQNQVRSGLEPSGEPAKGATSTSPSRLRAWAMSKLFCMRMRVSIETPNALPMLRPVGGRTATRPTQVPVHKSFLVLFFKKEQIVFYARSCESVPDGKKLKNSFHSHSIVPGGLLVMS
jgi:hypothetical protein